MDPFDRTDSMYSLILVAIDGSPTSSNALGEAVKLAQLSGARLRIAHIVDPIRRMTGFERPEVYVREILPALLREGEAVLAGARSQSEAAGVQTDTVLIEGAGEAVWQLLVNDAKTSGASLLVVGTHGRKGVNRVLLGSDAEQVARNATVPVLLVRPQG